MKSKHFATYGKETVSCSFGYHLSDDNVFHKSTIAAHARTTIVNQ